MPVGATARNGPELVVQSNFVGVVAEGQDIEEVLRDSVVVTWIGDESDQPARVVWTSESIELEDGAIAEYVGDLSGGEMADIQKDLVELGLVDRTAWMPSADAYGGGVICTLEIPYPYMTFSPDTTNSGVVQVCQGALEHRVSGKLQMNTWWVFYSTKDSDTSGWGSSTWLNATMSHPCDSQGPKNWRNWGHGEAYSPSGVYFNGPSAATNWKSFGCLG